MVDKMPQRPQSQPRERRIQREGRYLYNLHDLNKRSKSAPPGDRSKPTNIDPLPIAPDVRARLEYARYRTRIVNTSESPQKCEERLRQLDEFYNRMRNDEREPGETGRDHSYEEQWKPFRALEGHVEDSNEKRADYFEHEKIGFIPSYSPEEVNYQFNEHHMPESSGGPSPEDLSRLGIGTAEELRSYVPRDQQPSEAENATASTSSASNENTTAVYQWGMRGIDAFLRSGYVPDTVKERLQSIKDEFDQV